MHSERGLMDAAMKHIQTPECASHLAELVIKELAKVDGFDDLPQPLEDAIARCVAKLYGAGFVAGAQWTHWRL